jgi:hypothetical protein
VDKKLSNKLVLQEALKIWNSIKKERKIFKNASDIKKLRPKTKCQNNLPLKSITLGKINYKL